jgi:uncharacterized protein YdeI (YjbR/CyaY-like superfamily)
MTLLLKEVHMSERDFSKLQRERLSLPDFVRMALENRGLLEAYQQRPAYQQNDYIAWITRAKREETVQKRLEQMLDELGRCDAYMKMPYDGGN